jgi:hypothetical protein
MRNGKELSCPEGRRVKESSYAGFRRAIRNPKDFLEPGFPAKKIGPIYRSIIFVINAIPRS